MKKLVIVLLFVVIFASFTIIAVSGEHLDYISGDVNDDSTVNMLDVLMLAQYYVDGCKYDPAGYSVIINENAGDVDGNGVINMMDVLLLCQYYVDGCKYDPDGYGVELVPGKMTTNIAAVEAKAATCVENGNIAYWFCTECGKYFSDEAGENEISYEDTVIPATGAHTWNDGVVVVEAQCESVGYIKYTCTVCNAENTELIPKLGHDFDTVYTTDATEHWFVCLRCGRNSEKQAHTGGTATCAAKAVCSVCGVEYGEVLTGHSWNSGVVTTAATTTANGVMTYTCTVCGSTKTEVIPATGTDTYTLEGDEYIYFGKYPQIEVTSEELKATLNATIEDLPTESSVNGWTSYGYYDEGAVVNYMWYRDVTVGGSKYRAVYFTRYRPQSTVSSSSLRNAENYNGYLTENVYWFKFEPLKWRILSQNEDVALILCESIIDVQAYQNTILAEGGKHYNNSEGVPEGTYANNYEYSSIRAWLNDDFYRTAFNELQKALILETSVDNSARSTNPDGNATQWNSGNNVYACGNTNDKIFLLSEQEVTTSAYGFAGVFESGDNALTRQKQPTDYAKVQGAAVDGGNGVWWTRSPSTQGNGENVRRVYYSGYHGSSKADATDHGVVPALRIQIEVEEEDPWTKLY